MPKQCFRLGGTMKKYRNTQDFFMDLPETVLLVGNGRINGGGSLIDSYEFVVRFNSFVTDGFEKDVGSKVDAISFWCPNPSKTYHPPEKPVKINYDRYKGKVTMFTMAGGSTPDEYVLAPARDTRLINTYWTPYFEKSPVCECANSNTCHFGSGSSLALNLSIFFNKKVHVIGFDGWKTGHHYSKSITEDYVSRITNHEPSLERYIISKIKDITFLEV